jgi:N6-adenosine-specific RNA methylase IME4
VPSVPSTAIAKIRTMAVPEAHATDQLSLVERRRLEQLEAVVTRGLEAFVEVGRALIEIRDTRLYRESHTTFESYVNERFALARRTAYGYIEAVDVLDALGDVPTCTQISVSHLRALAPLEPDAQRELAPIVAPMTVVQARRVIRDWRLQQRATKNDRPPPPPFPDGTFRTLVADPPWRYENDWGQGLAGDQYPTMSDEEISRLGVADLAAPDSHLYLWTPVAKVRQAIDICEAWGFRYVGLLTWIKPGLGMGTWWRVSTEHIVFGARGRLPTSPNMRNWFEAPRRRHSAKPVEFFDIVERASPGPYLELFARSLRDGWTAWGDELGRLSGRA